jgi:hypothetical protein
MVAVAVMAAGVAGAMAAGAMAAGAGLAVTALVAGAGAIQALAVLTYGSGLAVAALPVGAATEYVAAGAAMTAIVVDEMNQHTTAESYNNPNISNHRLSFEYKHLLLCIGFITKSMHRIIRNRKITLLA